MKTLIAILFLDEILVPLPAFAVNTGDVAPGFSLKNVNGNTVTLNSLKGMVVFLTFWTTWCPSCKEELPDLNTLQRKEIFRFFPDCRLPSWSGKTAQAFGLRQRSSHTD